MQMTISKKLLIIVVLTIFEVSFTLWAVFQISKISTFHQLNFLHLKYNASFSSLVNELDAGKSIDTDELRKVVLQVKQQPIDCLDKTNFVDRIIMRKIGTDHALELCYKDIEDSDRALASIDKYSSGHLTRQELVQELKIALMAFADNSENFEKPVLNTVDFILKAFIPLILSISFFNIFFITYLSKNISGSINKVIALLSKDNSSDDDLSEQIERNVTGEIKQLLTVARKRIKNDIVNKEMTKELEELVEERTRSLKKANDELAQFAYRASHDLKSPLTRSKGLSKYILKDIESGDLEEAKSNSQKVLAQMESLEKLVTAILALAKADLENEEKESINFSDLIDEIKERLAWLTAEKDCKILVECRLTENLYLEKTRLSQMLENLIANGIKYMDESKPESFVRIVVSNKNQNQYSIVVEDNGVGIPENKKEDVFKMFKRFHPHLGSGSGLGMSIVKKHVDYMGGLITFSSTSKGTKFNINLPIDKDNRV